jgi:hypothetical protein
MREPEFTADQVRKRLWGFIRVQGPHKRTQLDLSRELGISPQFLNDILHGNREPCEKCLGYLGLEKVVIYRIPKRKAVNGEAPRG